MPRAHILHASSAIGRNGRSLAAMLAVTLAAGATGTMPCPDTRAVEFYHQANALQATDDDRVGIIRKCVNLGVALARE